MLCAIIGTYIRIHSSKLCKCEHHNKVDTFDVLEVEVLDEKDFIRKIFHWNIGIDKGACFLYAPIKCEWKRVA